MKKTSGITLVELLVAMVIGGFILLTIGLIIIYSQVLWQKAGDVSAMEGDLSYVRTKLGYKMRSATTHPFTLNGNAVAFRTIDRKVNTYVLNRVRLSGTDLIYEYFYGSTDPYSGSIVFNTAVAATNPEVIMRNVQSFNVGLLAGTTEYFGASFTITAQKTSNYKTGAKTVRIDTDTYKSRNW